MKSLFENEKANLLYNAETNAIELIWKKQHDKETYKMMFTKGLEYISEYKVTGWLSDITHEGIVGPELSKWLQEEIMPKAFANGLKKIAIVMDADVFKDFYIKNLQKNADSNVMKHFDSVDKANEWLLEN